MISYYWRTVWWIGDRLFKINRWFYKHSDFWAQVGKALAEENTNGILL